MKQNNKYKLGFLIHEKNFFWSFKFRNLEWLFLLQFSIARITNVCFCLDICGMSDSDVCCCYHISQFLKFSVCSSFIFQETLKSIFTDYFVFASFIGLWKIVFSLVITFEYKSLINLNSQSFKLFTDGINEHQFWIH